VLRGSLDQRPPDVGETPTFLDREGAPLDLARTFAWDRDDDEDMAHFLHQTGFLHVAGVFTEDEMSGVSADMDRAAPTYRQGDGRSWWARTAAGEERLVRMQGFDAMSPHASALVTDGRLARLAALTGDGHEWAGMDGNALEALVKPIGIVEGISDVPWHKDCSLGRHSYECSSLTVGISVTGADAHSGQLRVVGGSNRAFVWPAFVRRDNTLPLVDLPTSTGDVTVHLSCTMHMAQPPVDRERRVMYTGFRLPPLRPDAAAEARRRLRAVRETAAVTVSQPPSTVVG
jgi:Phytanoyl-CoA dioxygenase (PhyH)